MSPYKLIIVDSLILGFWNICVGLSARMLPSRLLSSDKLFLRLLKFERSGQVYKKLKINSWKDHLPEAGGWFGGKSKRHLYGWTEAKLKEFVVETRRAELVHWASLSIMAVFPIWNPFALTSIFFAWSLLANIPCIMVQRYNRARIYAIIDRRNQKARRRVAASLPP